MKKNQETEESDRIQYLLESRIWEVFVRRMFKDSLERMKKALLVNKGLPENERYGYILTRQTILEALQAQYKKHNVDLPEWLGE